MKIKLFIKTVIKYFRKKRNENLEIIWANIYHDTKNGIKWCEDIGSISPGRFAVGYNYLYVMTRVLNEMQPKYVLDLGLGISSSLISAYYKGMNIENGKHIIVEHNDAWIGEYLKKHDLSEATTIYPKRLIETKNICEYDNFEEGVENIKYDVISIDAPYGSDRNSRHDVLKILPKCLAESFVIIIDDADRRGEKDTIKEIKKTLSDNNIKFYDGLYKGMTYCHVIVSEDLKFICSL